MPTAGLTRQEQEQLYHQYQNERPSRHQGGVEQQAVQGRSAAKERYDGETREERKDREERKNREDKEYRANGEHRRHRSDRTGNVDKTHHDVGSKRHSHMPETALRRAEVISTDMARSLERDYQDSQTQRRGLNAQTIIQTAERQLSYQPGAAKQACGHYLPPDMPIITFAIFDRILHRYHSNNPYGLRNANGESGRESGPAAANRYPTDSDPVTRAKETLSRSAAAPPPANKRSVAIDPDVTYVSAPSYPSVASPPPAHIPPARRSPSFRSYPQDHDYDESKPLPAPPHARGPHGQSPLDPELQPPYWMETIGHAIWTLVITFGHLFGTAATSILIVILGLIHCIMTSVLLVVGAVFDGLTTMLRIFFNLITCHFQSGEWGWEWTHLIRAWQWGRKSQWVWECVGRVNTETEERDEKVARRLSLHEARKEEYKREQEEKAQMQAQNQLPPANKRHGVAALYGGRSMACDLEKGYGPDHGTSRGPYY